ncbi:MAG: hypothetical protein QOG79_5552 [Mycobacterium sp.]|nr:hypothetical protein [Mycobacterium sp.]MDT5286472.1 hypothetical protein [Mycobacterium sp.]MDT5302310.1 hypothetical protein [Mycobacterium sp.]
MSNRPSYVSFGLALMVGYGAFALSYGDDPILPMPSAAPGVLLLVGLLTALTITGVAITKARRGHDTVIGKMLAASWLVGLAVAGGGAYLVAAALEPRRHTGAAAV